MKTLTKTKPVVFYGWIIVAAGFFIELVTYGAMYSFGVFLKPLAHEFGWTRAVTAGAFSLFMIIQGIFYIISGRFTDRFGPRIVVASGGLFIFLGLFLTSHTSSTWQLYLFYGLIVGMGIGSIYVPLASTLTRWFSEKRGLALGIVISASPLGTLFFSPGAQYLISTYGWRISYLIIGLTALIVIISASQLLKQQPDEKDSLLLSNCSAKKQMAASNNYTLSNAVKTHFLWALAVVQFLSVTAGFIAIIHVVAYATDIGMAPMVAAGLLGFIGASQALGRFGGGFISDFIGGKKTMLICLAIQAAALFILSAAKELPVLYLAVFLFGASHGGIVPQFPRILGAIFGLKQIGFILGVITSFACIGGAFGSWIGGKLFDLTGTYSLAFVTGGLATIAALLIVSFLKIPKDA